MSYKIYSEPLKHALVSWMAFEIELKILSAHCVNFNIPLALFDAQQPFHEFFASNVEFFSAFHKYIAFIYVLVGEGEN